MLLNPVLQRFVEQAPLAVLARSLLERAVAPADLDRLFHDHARDQRARQLLFSAVVDTLALVVYRAKPSVPAPFTGLIRVDPPFRAGRTGPKR